MTQFFPLLRRLAFLLLLVLSLGFAPSVSAQSWNVYGRVDQTDADYAPEQIEKLLDALERSDIWVRASVLRDLEALSPESRAAVPQVIDLINRDSIVKNVIVSPPPESSFLASVKADAVAPLVKTFPQSLPEAKWLIVQTATILGTDARELLPLLTKEYKSATEPEASWYLQAIAATDPTGETAFPLLLKLLHESPDKKERSQAADCLRNQEHPPYSWIQSQARQWYLRGTQNPDKAVEALLQALKDQEPSVRGAAAGALAGYRDHGQQIVPELLRLLDDEGEYLVALSTDLGVHEQVSDVAARALISFPESADETVPKLVKRELRRQGLDIVIFSDDIFPELIPRTARPLEHLRTLLKGEQPELALLTIARMGKAAQPLIPQIEPLTRSAEEPITVQATLTLACLDPKWQPVANQIIEQEYAKLFDDENADGSAVNIYLESIGENAAFAHPVVLRSFRRTLQDQRLHSFEFSRVVEVFAALGKVDQQTVSSILDHASFDINAAVSSEAALIKMAPGINPFLIERLNDPDVTDWRRILYYRILGAAHAESPELVPLVVARLRSEHPAVRESVVQALGEIGTKNDDSLQALIKALNDPRVLVREQALESLAKFGHKTKPAVSHIVKCLSDGYLTVRVAAVRCLGDIGPAASDAIDQLKILKDDESQLLRETAAEALAKIQAN